MAQQTDIEHRYKWVNVLRDRALEYRRDDPQTASFLAPRASVAKLCRITRSAIDLVVALDELHDNDNENTRHRAKVVGDRLLMEINK